MLFPAKNGERNDELNLQRLYEKFKYEKTLSRKMQSLKPRRKSTKTTNEALKETTKNLISFALNQKSHSDDTSYVRDDEREDGGIDFDSFCWGECCCLHQKNPIDEAIAKCNRYGKIRKFTRNCWSKSVSDRSSKNDKKTTKYKYKVFSYS